MQYDLTDNITSNTPNGSAIFGVFSDKSTKELEKSFAKKRSKISFSSCSEAFKAAIKTAKPYDLIVVGGSTFVVSEILRDFYP